MANVRLSSQGQRGVLLACENQRQTRLWVHSRDGPGRLERALRLRAATAVLLSVEGEWQGLAD